MHRRWVARMSCVISIAILAFVTNWGLFRLTELGSVGSDYRDDATTSGPRLRLAVAEPNCKPRSSREH